MLRGREMEGHPAGFVKLCLADQQAAKEGIDPKRDEPSRSDTFEAVVNEYIDREQVARKENDTAEEVRRILLKDCAAWKNRDLPRNAPSYHLVRSRL